MERRAQAAESRATETSGKDALDHAIQAAELYMRAAGDTPSKADATRLRRKCQEMITYAERLKSDLSETAQSAPSASRGPIVAQPTVSPILQLGSRLHGNEFPIWQDEPKVDEFDPLPGDGSFTDNTTFSLSTNQMSNFAAWVRPAELFRLDQQSDRTALEDAMMQVSASSNLVQDITTDCSVVASLSAAFNVLTGRHAVLSSIFYPFDLLNKKPRLSHSGKYVMKLNFNGCARKVVVDDRLPSSRTSRALFVVDRQNPYLLWPALLEKAYLKVRGGYDFPGSNSGTDLWVLIGWIPEQLFLQREDIDLDNVWKRIQVAHKSGNVVVTLGTGRVSAEEEEVMGLIGEHDYAVENIDTSGGSRRLLIKNPWCDGPSMTTLGWSNTQHSGLSEAVNHGSSQKRSMQEHAASSTLWVAFEDVAQHFESMYLNWNPALFPCRRDHHFAWELPPKLYSASLSRNPQFSVSAHNAGTIWVLVSRHFVDAELDIARERRDSMAAVARQLGFMSILAFENGGRKLQICRGEIYRGPYVDSPQTLARLYIRPGRPYTIVVDQHELPLPRYHFTLSLFSHSPLVVEEASETMSHFAEQLGAWTRRTSGGNSSCCTYFQNPQYRLSVDRRTPVSILLCADTDDIHVHVDVVWAQGRRVDNIRVKDLLASSGEYRRGCAVADIAMLEPGVYTLVCSAFDAGQLGQFSLRVGTMAPIMIRPVPADSAGRFATKLPQIHLPQGDERFRLPLDVSWLTKASVSMHSSSAQLQLGSRANLQSSQVLRVSIIYCWGPEQVTIAVSGENEFQDPANTVRTPQFDMEPDRIRREGLWILVESMGSHGGTLAIDGEISSDSPVRVGDWECV